MYMADKIPYNPMPQKTTASSLVYISFYFPFNTHKHGD